MNFASQYFFEVKQKSNTNYKIMLIIFQILIAILWISIIILDIFSCQFIYSKIKYHIKQHVEKVQDNSNNDSNSLSWILRETHLPALLLSSVLMHFTLFAFHIMSIVEFMNYGSEIFEDAHQKNISQSHAIASAGEVVFIVIAIVAIAITQRDYWNFSNALSITFTVHIVYIGSYFSPFILLAFITDPLQTCFIYLMEAGVASGAYLLSLFLCSFFIGIKKDKVKDTQVRRFVSLTLGLGILVILSIVALNFLITLGNFHDYDEIQRLWLPLLVAIFTYFVFKPTYQYAKKQPRIAETI